MSKDTKHYFNPNHQTGWNACRDQSTWHFDPVVDESAPDPKMLRKNFVQFRGDWQADLDDAKFDREPPFDLSEFLTRGCVQESMELNLDYKKNISTRSIVTDHSGHPKLWQIVKELGISEPYAMIYKQRPGQINWLHIDNVCCHDTIDRSDVDSYDLKQDKDLVRVLVALEDWQWGHFAQMGNHLWHQWRAGDIVWFDWQNLPHCTANAGHLDRHFLKITGRMTDKFANLLNQDSKIINIS